MDPYLDVIPNDRGEEIRKCIRDRDSSDSQGPSIKRKRADTTSLLPPQSDDQDTAEPPKPEDNLDKYDRERLQKGLRYIHQATKRKITPRTEEFLKLHKEAYKTALHHEIPDQSSRVVVQAMDRVYYSAAFHFKPRPSAEHDRLMSYVKLRRLELLVNYSDYLGHELQVIRAKLKKAAISASFEVQTAAAELGPPKTWLEIANDLEETDMNDLRKHVYVACEVLGIDPEHILWLIKEWGDRNRIFHNQIREFIYKCQWSRLAAQISRDLKELLNVAPNSETAASYEKVLLSIQNEYFDVYDRDDHETWFPNEEAKELAMAKVIFVQRLQSAIPATSMHELGHAFGLKHNVSETDNSFMNRTNTIIRKATAANPFPNNIKWNYADENLLQLRHWPDVYIRPGGTEFTSATSINPPIAPTDEALPMPNLELTLKPLHTTVPLGAPLVPQDISLKSPFLSGTVTDPAGRARSFHPLVCYDRLEEFQPLHQGDSISTSLTLLRGGHGALFPTDGIAEILAKASWTGLDGDSSNASNGGSNAGDQTTELFVLARTTVMVTAPQNPSHAAAAHRILTTPDTHVVLVLGGDYLDEGIGAIGQALRDETLRPHFAAVEARRRAMGFGGRGAEVEGAAELVGGDLGQGMGQVVMSEGERGKLERLGVRCGGGVVEGGKRELKL